MGRLSAFLFLVAACGDNGPVTDAPDPLHATLVSGGLLTQAPTARLTPIVCGVAEWAVPAGADRALDLSIATSHGITSIVAVPQAGGAMTGFAVDSRMEVVTDPRDTKIPIDGTLSHVSASMVGDRMLTATTDGTAVRVHLFDEFLQNPQQVAKLDATTFSKPAFMTANSTPVIVTGGLKGLSMTTVSANFGLGETKLIAPSAAVTSLATAQYGGAVLAAWTTSADECYVSDVASFVSGASSHTSMPCAHPRLAADIAHNSASLVFEQDGAVRMMHISHMQMGGVSSLLRPDGHSPRIVFDGARYWVSYIDARGGIVVGLLDGSRLTSMALIGPAPSDEAYELALVDGRVIVVALSVQGNYTAHQMCAVAAAD
jgi:hypothetical protein